MTSYTQAPPSYTPGAPKGYSAIPQDEEAQQQSYGGPSAAHEYDPNAPRQEGDVDNDDFKFGVTVDQCDAEVRMQFLKKVYSILFLQIAGTTVVAGVMTTNNVASWVRANQWAFLVPLFGSLVTMGFLFWKRHSHPLNLGLLGLFTLLESLALGSVVTYVDQLVVLQALTLTTFVFLGLTIFTFQSKYDFSSLGNWLFGGLLLLVGVGFVQLFLPFNQMFDMITAAFGVVIFSGYIIFDTWLITKKLSPDEWVLAVVSLYLDFVNLFINILRLLNGNRDD
ncbi:unnamed protein product [Sympodiomycopsis kandeliae]